MTTAQLKKEYSWESDNSDKELKEQILIARVNEKVDWIDLKQQLNFYRESSDKVVRWNNFPDTL